MMLNGSWGFASCQLSFTARANGCHDPGRSIKLHPQSASFLSPPYRYASSLGTPTSETSRSQTFGSNPVSLRSNFLLTSECLGAKAPLFGHVPSQCLSKGDQQHFHIDNLQQLESLKFFFDSSQAFKTS